MIFDSEQWISGALKNVTGAAIYAGAGAGFAGGLIGSGGNLKAALTSSFQYMYNQLQGLDARARHHLKKIREGSAYGAEMIAELEASERLYTVRFGDDRRTSGKFVDGKFDIVINRDDLASNLVPATDGNWYQETSMRAVAHELGHAQMIEKYNAYLAAKTYFHTATTIENLIAKKLNPNAWQRIGHSFKKKGF